MKKILNKLIRNEKGQALVLALVLLLVGGLLITPLMAFMSTGLKVGQVYEERMDELYAADAGVEDASWKIVNGDASLPGTVGYSWTYSIADVNGKDVDVEIVMEEDIDEFLYDLLQERYSGVHSDWTVVEEVVETGIYTITVTYNGVSQKKHMDGVGAWLEGDYEYVADSASGIIDDYPVFNFEVTPYKGGTAFVWEWTGGNRPEFGTQSGVFTRTLIFEFTPEEVPSFHFSWAVVDSANIGVVTSGYTLGIWKVTATATDSTTGKQTTVVAYVLRQGEGAPYPVNVITWKIILQ